MFRSVRSSCLFKHSLNLGRRAYLSRAQFNESEALLRKVYSRRDGLEEGSPEDNALLDSGIMWHDWYRHGHDVTKGYSAIQSTFKHLLAQVDASKLEMRKSLAGRDALHQTILISSRQSCAIEGLTISIDKWMELNEFLNCKALELPLRIPAEEVASRSFHIPEVYGSTYGERDTMQEVGNHILVNSWFAARHFGKPEGTVPCLTIEEIGHVLKAQMRYTGGDKPDSDGSSLGSFRSHEVGIYGAHLSVFPYPREVRANLERLFAWLQEADIASKNLSTGIHPVLVAIQLMMYFVMVHPFSDGNGRTSRLLLQDHVYRHGYGPVILPEPLDRELYIDRIQQAAKESPTELVRMYLHAVIRGCQALSNGGKVISASDP